jgi:hypothetical protein
MDPKVEHATLWAPDTIMVGVNKHLIQIQGYILFPWASGFLGTGDKGKTLYPTVWN